MKISSVGSTPQQAAYARRVWAGKGVNKKQIALDVGYSPYVANSVVSKIESKRGFHNAMAKLASDSGNVALSVMHELKSRGFKNFSDRDLIASLNAIAGAWDRFNKGMIEAEKPKDNGKNRLRTVVLQRVENQVNNNIIEPPVEPEPEDPVIVEAETKESPNLDF